MKKYILLSLLFISSFGFSQSYPNGIYVGKGIMPYPTGAYSYRLGFGTLAPASDFDFTTIRTGMLLPRLTQGQADARSAVNSELIFNTTTNQFEWWKSAVSDWVSFTGYQSLQEMYDANPTNTTVTDGVNTATISPSQLAINTNLGIDEAGVIGVFNTGGVNANISVENASGIDGARIYASNGGGFSGEIRGDGSIVLSGTGIQALIKSDNITDERTNQLPDANGTLVASASVGATKVTADTEGNLDISSLVTGGGLTNPLTTDLDGGANNLVNIQDVEAALGDFVNVGVSGTLNGGTISGNNSGDQTALTTPNTPAGNISATNVQDAINELDLAISSSSRLFKVNSGAIVRYLGDSYTVGTGATSSAYGWSRLSSDRMGVEQLNLGFAGGGILKGFNNVNTTGAFNSTVKNKLKTIIMLGFNDHIRGGADARELAKIENGYNALFASMFAETAIPANSGSITQTGTWTAFTPSTFPTKAVTLSGQPLSNTTSGNKLTYTLSGTTLIVGYVTNDATATGVTFSNFDVVVDGTVLANVDTNDKSLAVTDSYYNNQYAPGAIVFKNLAAGSHTVEIVNKTNNLLYIDWVGSLMPPNNCGDVMVCSIPLINAAGYATQPTYSPSAITSALADTAIKNAMANYSEYPLIWNDINAGFISTDVAGDFIHYNDAGHARLANNVMKSVSNNSVAPIISSYNDKTEPVSIYGVNYTMNAGAPVQIKTGITSEGLLLDTSAASTVAGMAYHTSTAGVQTQYWQWGKNGNFGVATASVPTYKFEVNGTARFASNFTLDGNLLTDLTIQKTTPKITFDNNVAVISASLFLNGNATQARGVFQPNTANKNVTFGISPSGTATSSTFLAYGAEGISSGNYNYMAMIGNSAGTGGIYSVAVGSGTLQPLNLGMGSTAYFTMGTTGNSTFTNALTVGTESTANHATRKTYVDALTYSYAVNSATTGLSSATLNSTYPSVPVGYRVICPSITLGGAIYTKATEAGSSDVWLMCSAPVAP